MPIRHCQKCGLKVLIDESQTNQNPFYCQRCTASLKSESRSVPGDTPAGVGGTKKGDSGAKPAMVKVNCPYCKASFNGRIPQKPARGACPVCQKELILLPNGEIRSSAGFDLAKWQQEGDVKKYAAAPAAEAKPGTRSFRKEEAAPATQPPSDDIRITEVIDEPAPASAVAEGSGGTDPGKEKLPSWLDDDTTAPPNKAEPAEEERVAVSTEEPPVPALPEEPAPVPSADAQAEEPMPAAVEDPPPPPPEPEPAPEPRAAVAAKRLGGTKRLESQRAAMAVASATGLGMVLLAFILFALPVGAAPFLWKAREKLKKPLEMVGKKYTAGFKKLHEKLNPPPPKKEEAPAPPPPPEEKKEEPKVGPEEQKQFKDEMNKLAREVQDMDKKLRQDLLVATEAQKAELKPVQDKVAEKRERIATLREQYKKLFNEDYDPFKE